MDNEYDGTFKGNDGTLFCESFQSALICTCGDAQDPDCLKCNESKSNSEDESFTSPYPRYMRICREDDNQAYQHKKKQRRLFNLEALNTLVKFKFDSIKRQATVFKREIKEIVERTIDPEVQPDICITPVNNGFSFLVSSLMKSMFKLNELADQTRREINAENMPVEEDHELYCIRHNQKHCLCQSI